MKQKIRKHWEALLIQLAIYILLDRNISRSAVVSRRDNNRMWGMSEELEAIRNRILDEYNNI
ncbi:hypothetical protein [Agarilytica rhodophyticola]|uniref:hypothetical protein n=1 Tax=Agarilytica rhodophyticola TaxID=1737490 RepID=UPI000B348CC6|nr:hypothetical protein [Agarilytica rhodophyticola]